jgi:hypothetical protein
LSGADIRSTNFPKKFAMSADELQPALDISGWLPFEGLRPGKLKFDSVDQALDRLRQPTLIEDRLSVLQHVVNYWHGPIRPKDGMTEAELAGSCFPAALHWWYRWAGRRSTIVSGQNFLFAPRGEHGQPFMLDDRLFFYVENQGVYHWATLAGGDDPPVFGRYNDNEPWEAEGIKVTEHLILACLFEAVMRHARFQAAAAWLDEDQFAAVVNQIPPLAIPPWRWIEAKFFARNGAFMCATDQGLHEGKRWYSVNVGAKTERPLQFLKPLLDKSWEYVSI